MNEIGVFSDKPSIRRAGCLPWFITQLLVVLMAGCAVAKPQSGLEAAYPVAASAFSPARRDSVDAYLALLEQHPSVVAYRGAHARGEIEIVLDAAHIRRIEADVYARYAKRFDDALAFTASRAGIVLEDPFLIVVRDAVIFPNGKEGLYDRKISRSTLDGGVAGAYCLPVLPDGRVILVKEFRHQERAWRLGLSGGFREAGESAEQAAKREVLEETGLALDDLVYLGQLDGEGEAVPLYRGAVHAAAGVTRPDDGEALAGTLTLSPAELNATLVRGYHLDTDGRTYHLHGALAAGLILLQGHAATAH